MAKMSGLGKLIAGVCLVSAPVFGYEFFKINNMPIRWNRPVIEYEIDPELPECYRQSAERSAREWEKALDGIIVFREGRKENGIYITKGRLSKPWDAETWLDRSENEIIRGEISFNEERVEWVMNMIYHLNDIMTHEFGHILGLADVYCSEYDRPTMNPSLNGTQATVHQDDINGIGEIYGLSPKEPRPIEVYRKGYRLHAVGVDDKAMWTYRGKTLFGSSIRAAQKRKPVSVVWNGRRGEYRFAKMRGR